MDAKINKITIRLPASFADNASVVAREAAEAIAIRILAEKRDYKSAAIGPVHVQGIVCKSEIVRKIGEQTGLFLKRMTL